MNASARILALCVPLCTWTAAMGGSVDSKITYQGQLKQSGVAATGDYDMRFTLHDAATGGATVGPTLIFDGIGGFAPISVADGLFTVQLDFGTAAFDGGALWLGIEVRPTGEGPYVLLDPRQPLTAAPYAMFALDGPGSAGFWQANGNDIHNSNSGHVGIGTATPVSPLEVRGAANSQSVRFTGADGNYRFLQQLNAADEASFTFRSAVGAPQIRFASDGSVGIGTSSPGGPLHVTGTPQRTVFGDNTGTAANASGGYFQIQSTTGQGVFGQAIASTGVTYGGRFSNNSTSGYGVFGLAAAGTGTTYGVYGRSGTTADAGAGVAGESTGGPALYAFKDLGQSGPGLRIRTNDVVGFKLLEFEQTSINSSGSAAATMFLNDDNGNDIVLGLGGGAVGVGAQPTIARLAVVAVDPDQIGVFASSDNGNAGQFLILNGNNSKHALEGYTDGTGVAVHGHTGGNGNAGYFVNRSATNSGTALYCRTDGTGLAFHAEGRARVEILEITGADVAERFPTSESGDIAPGTVMEIDPDHPGMLRVSRGAYNRRVAGVVSGAGDIPVGAILGNMAGNEDAPAIALSGRVWVQCVAADRPIEPGDLLTTAERAGCAMRVEDHGRATGATIGKAMSTLAAGESGLVLVLVNLQ